MEFDWNHYWSLVLTLLLALISSMEWTFRIILFFSSMASKISFLGSKFRAWGEQASKQVTLGLLDVIFCLTHKSWRCNCWLGVADLVQRLVHNPCLCQNLKMVIAWILMIFPLNACSLLGLMIQTWSHPVANCKLLSYACWGQWSRNGLLSTPPQTS